jgi:prevent-host-death family protein
MRISVSEAKGQLTELVRRAEAGDEVVLTRHGKETVRLVPVQPQPNVDARRAVIAAMQAAAEDKRITGAVAARSQDFLYDDEGLPK